MNRTLIGLIGLISTDVSGTTMCSPRRDYDRGADPEFVVKSLHISPISPISVLFPIMTNECLIALAKPAKTQSL